MRIIRADTLSPSLSYEVVGCWSIARCGMTGATAESTIQRFTRSDIGSRPCKSNEIDLELLLVDLVRESSGPRLGLDHGLPSIVVKILEQIAPSKRLPFIPLFYKYSEAMDFDIDVYPPSERERRLAPIWAFKILRVLPDSDAKCLFSRMLTIHGCEEFVPTPKAAKSLDWTKQCLLKIGWEEHAASRHDLPFSRTVIKEMQERARQGRYPELRLDLAGAALDAGIATSSLDIYASVVHWTKRFMRDPLVFPNLVKEKLLARDAASLLSCVDIDPRRRPTSLPQLHHVVQQANKIIENLLELILLAIQEPAGKKDLMGWLFAIMSEIIGKRMKGLYQYHPQLGNEMELVNVLLEPLMPIVLDFERVIHSGEPSMIGVSTQKGLLEDLNCPSHPTEAVVAFMDKLAERRDRLWEEIRTNADPALCHLGKGWPKGLPVQHLLPNARWTCCALEYRNAAPFVRNRITQIITTSFHDTLSPKPNVRPSGEWIDSLRYAIEAYIGAHKTQKQQNLISLFHHYNSEIEVYACENRHHPEQVQMFRRWLRDLAVALEAPEAAAVIWPYNASVLNATFLDRDLKSDDVFLWDPRHDFHEEDEEESKQIPVTLLYCRMHGVIPRSKTVSLRRKPITNPLVIWKLDRESLSKSELSFLETQEAIILSAILFLNSTGPQKRLLARPFPTIASPRYPAISLDDCFVAYAREDSPHAEYTAKKALEKAIKAVPDRPELAVDIILRVIQHMLDASSWHRQLKLAILGKRLKPDSAKDFIERFATFTMDGLQRNRRQGGQSMPNMAEAAGHPKLFVKTTTVKMLGEVLAVANFLPTTMIMSVLHDLFNASHHVDIRARVISSVICLFDIAFDTEAIFRACASFAFIVAGPSETEPTTETDWVNAENGGKLPHISLRGDRPALDLFVKTAYYKVPKPHRAGAFLHCYDIANTCAFETFDFGPFRVNIVEDILHTWADYLPEPFLPRHRDFALSYLRYADLNRLSEALAQQEPGYWQRNPGNIGTNIGKPAEIRNRF
ncbi:hypothetical protein ETB97_005365 [Aspergillus alliaceus]|uniref:Uncharacterized protein n=1 Tax=Petromyces alliaceus TaxID=209559 RepID=A0A8H6EA27_PETAA|nr:hypothetical protein ETB97_005365 [Aspergillus burnettii]